MSSNTQLKLSHLTAFTSWLVDRNIKVLPSDGTALTWSAKLGRDRPFIPKPAPGATFMVGGNIPAMLDIKKFNRSMKQLKNNAK